MSSDDDNSFNDILLTSGYSSALFQGAGIIGKIFDCFDGESKDGIIDETSQGATGDCWLLSGINAFSYTEEGREIIKDALEYQDGYTIVHLAVGDYLVTDDEIITTKGSFQYSSGDDDMIIFELAIEKVRDDIADEEFTFTYDSPWQIGSSIEMEATTMFNSSTQGGHPTEVWYYLTGKVGQYASSYEKKEAMLDKFIENGSKDYAMGTRLGEDTKVQDINGKKVKLAGNHAYAVKSADEDMRVRKNPKNDNF